MQLNVIHHTDALTGLKSLPDNSIDCIVTSPPYFSQRVYSDSDLEIGIEDDFMDYIDKLLEVFTEAKRVLNETGTCWVNLGDTYGGAGHGYELSQQKAVERAKQMKGQPATAKLNKTHYNKSMLMLPYRFAVGMVDNGWKCRNVIIWHRINQMPQGVFDRFTNDFEPIFFFTKSDKYYFKQQLEPYDKPLNRYGGDTLVADGQSDWSDETGQKIYRKRNMRPNPDGRNMRTVWPVNTVGSKEKHYAMYPERLAKRCIDAGCPENGIVLDMFMGAATTALVARKLNRSYIGFDINKEYVVISNNRLHKELGFFA